LRLSILLFAASVGSATVASATSSPPLASAASSASPPASAAPADSLALARDLNRQQRFAEAEALARRDLARFALATPVDSLVMADAMEVIVEALWRGGHAAGSDAADLARRALAIRERLQGKAAAADAATLFQLANVLRRTGDYRGGRAALERSVRIREHALGPADPLVAQSLNSLGNLLREMGELDAADSSYRRALAIREKAFGPEATEVGQTLNGLGVLERDRGHDRAALPIFERVLAIQQKALGPDHPEVAIALENIGTVHAALGDLASARGDYEQALEIRTKRLGPDHPETASTENNLGQVLVEDGRFADAESLFTHALATQERAFSADHPTVATSLVNLGSLLGKSRPERAIALLERALEIRRRAFGDSNSATADARAQLGSAELELGDLARGRQDLAAALSTDERVLGPEHVAVAAILAELATADRLLDRDREALASARRALAIRRRVLGADAIPVAQSEILIALALEDLGRPGEARPALERARAIQERALGADHPLLATTFDDLAGIERELGDWKDSRSDYERALALWRRTLGGSNRSVAYALHDLSLTLVACGDSVAALDTALAAAKIARENMRTSFRLLPEGRALALGSTTWSGLDLAVTLASRARDPARRRGAFDALIRSRAVVLDEMVLRRRRELAAGDTASAAGLMRLESATERLSALSVSDSRSPAAIAARNRALADRDAAERALAAGGRDLLPPADDSLPGLQAVCAALEPGAAMVAFARHYAVRPGGRMAGGVSLVLDREAYSAFVLTPGSRTPFVVRLGSAAWIDSLVQAWRREAAAGLASHTDAADAEGACRAAGMALKHAIWDPVAPAVLGASRVFVVPDGELDLVNFGALPAARPGRYLVESGPLLHMLTAERDVTRPAAAPETAPRLLAIGAPDFDASPFDSSARSRSEAAAGTSLALRGGLPACTEFAGVHFASLPGAALELDRVVARWPTQGESAGAGGDSPLRNRDLLVGAAATEAAFRSEAPRASWLHVATHGFFLSGECTAAASGTRGIGLLTADVAGGVPAKSRRPTARMTTEPLRLSGLALAGANRRSTAAAGQDDGILTAEEIATLDLSNVRWVVLSACETGLGEVRQGEVVLGLRRAFLLAGARTLVTSLWPIGDAPTLSFMDALYAARLRRGLPADEAMRSAAISMLAARRTRGEGTHPFFWGGFVASGDWR